jgi:hypothetical protein
MDQKRKLYLTENVEIDTGEVQDQHPSLVALLDKSPHNFPNLIGQSEKKRGLFWLLEEEAANPKSTDETFLDVVFDVFGDREDQNLISRVGRKQLLLQHMTGLRLLVVEIGHGVILYNSCAFRNKSSVILYRGMVEGSQS